MSKKAGKVMIGLACAGAVLGAVFAYLGIKKKHSEPFDDDFDDFSDEFEAEERTYTTIPKDTSGASDADPATAQDCGGPARDCSTESADADASSEEEYLDEEDEADCEAGADGTAAAEEQQQDSSK